MAAVDKLYVRTYEDYDDVRRWALACYPKLFVWFYDTSYPRGTFANEIVSQSQSYLLKLTAN